jgi:hypothetical protein
MAFVSSKFDTSQRTAKALRQLRSVVDGLLRRGGIAGVQNRDVHTFLASSSAMARPIPREPPVTIA